MCFSFIISLLLCCVSKNKDFGVKTDNLTILTINQKLEDGTITYEDIFESDYGVYAERTAETRDVLTKLVSKAYYLSSKNKNNNGSIKIDFSKIFENNKDKIVDRILDEKNLKYSIYPSNGGEKWFANDKNVKAPFNFLQQNIVLMTDKQTLEDISVALFDKLVNTKRLFTLNVGTFWVLYGNGYQLEKIFGMMRDYVNMCEEKLLKKEKLTSQDIIVLKEISQLNQFVTIKTSDFTEYLAKKIVINKIGVFLERAQDMLNYKIIKR